LQTRIPSNPTKTKIANKQEELSLMLISLQEERVNLEAQYDALVRKLDETKQASASLIAELAELTKYRRSEVEHLLLVPEFVASSREKSVLL
jgi:peptidoglycan hydrolase CwlO-like protein